MRQTMEIEYVDDEGLEILEEVPAVFEVCSRCNGHGTYLNPSIGEHAYSWEEFHEAFPFDEDREQYFTRAASTMSPA